jgi:hypothetical protein
VTSQKTDDHRLLENLNERIRMMAESMEKTQIAEYVQLMNKPRRLIWLNLVFGISRGIGIAIGFTIFTSSIIYLLKALGALNLPIIGGFIADIVKHVQYQWEIRGY